MASGGPIGTLDHGDMDAEVDDRHLFMSPEAVVPVTARMDIILRALRLSKKEH